MQFANQACLPTHAAQRPRNLLPPEVMYKQLELQKSIIGDLGTYILHKLGIVQLVESVDSIAHCGACCTDSSVQLVH